MLFKWPSGVPATVDALNLAVQQARPGTHIVYWIGYLPTDKKYYPGLGDISRVALQHGTPPYFAFNAIGSTTHIKGIGDCDLSQVRLGNFQYEYRLTKRSVPYPKDKMHSPDHNGRGVVPWKWTIGDDRSRNP